MDTNNTIATRLNNRLRYNKDMNSFALRRAKLLKLMQKGMAIIPNAYQPARWDHFEPPYRTDSTFFYLTGISEPNTWLILDATIGQSIFFCNEKNPSHELWVGKRLDPQTAKEEWGFDEAYPVEVFNQHLSQLLSQHQTIFWPMGKNSILDQHIKKAIHNKPQVLGKSTHKVDETDLLPLISQMRLIKEPQEIESLQLAGKISAMGHRRAMQSVKPNQFEYHIEAELLYEFVQQGARKLAYETIVAAGGNACTLHYGRNNTIMLDGELLLIDAGCEWEGYAGDITRTIPINGRFSPAQKDVYEIVLAAQLAAIAVIKPNANTQDIGLAALRILVQGLLDLKLLSGDIDGIIECQAYKPFYMHGIGHWIGLDVHDVGGSLNTQPIPLKPNMCLTVEPGLYIRAHPTLPQEWHNMGIRIEDDVVVTTTGCHVYTAEEVPKTVNAIEELMRGS